MMKMLCWWQTALSFCQHSCSRSCIGSCSLLAFALPELKQQTPQSTALLANASEAVCSTRACWFQLLQMLLAVISLHPKLFQFILSMKSALHRQCQMFASSKCSRPASLQCNLYYFYCPFFHSSTQSFSPLQRDMLGSSQSFAAFPTSLLEALPSFRLQIATITFSVQR